MNPPSVRSRSRRVRLGLLLAVVVAAGLLAASIISDPRRIGVVPDVPGRSAGPGEAGWVRVAPAPIALTEVAAAAHQDRIWIAGGLWARLLLLGGPQPGLTVSDVVEVLDLR